MRLTLLFTLALLLSGCSAGTPSGVTSHLPLGTMRHSVTLTWPDRPNH